MKFSRLILANLFRKKVRLLLTLGSFAVALFLFAFLAVVRDAFNRGGGIASANRLVTINRVSIIQPIPLSYRDKIAAHSGRSKRDARQLVRRRLSGRKELFPAVRDRPGKPAPGIPRVASFPTTSGMPSSRTARARSWARARPNALAGRSATASPSRPPFMAAGAWEFNIDGIYHGQRKEDDETQFWFQWDYFEERVPERFKGQVGWYTVKLDSPDDAIRVAKTIDAEFANSPYETKTDTESAFAASWVKQFGNIEFLILAIGSVVFFTLLLVTGNTMAISVRERTGELAILKAIGFKDGSILFLVLAEALAIALFGGFWVWVWPMLAIPVLGSALSGMLPNLILSKSMLAAGIGFALLVGAMQRPAAGNRRHAFARRGSVQENLKTIADCRLTIAD